MDGVEYAAVARNMAEDHGTFWKPYLSDTVRPVHHEHPPLIYWLQSLLFRVFGDCFYFEGLYSFAIALATCGVLALFWNRVRRDFSLPQAGAWWPLLLLTLLAVRHDYSGSNRLVITWVVIATLTTYFAYRSIADRERGYLFAVIAGIAVYLGLIAKGPVALFSLAVPAIGWLALRIEFRRAFVMGSVMTAVTSLCFAAATLISPESLEFWEFFMRTQVLASLAGERDAETYTYYFHKLWTELIAPVGVITMLALVTWTPVRKILPSRLCAFFFLIALAGSLPFFFSPRQKLRYILHAFPSILLSLAFMTDEVAIRIEAFVRERRRLRIALGATASLCFAVAIGAMIYKKDTVVRAHEYYNDIYLQDVQLPERSTVSVYPEWIIDGNFLSGRMARHHRVSLTGELGNDYLLVLKESDFVVPEGYERVQKKPTVKYDLYRRVNRENEHASGTSPSPTRGGNEGFQDRWGCSDLLYPVSEKPPQRGLRRE